MDHKLIDAISSTSKTGLITLYAHSLESRAKDSILRDTFAETMTAALDEILSESEDPFLINLSQGKLAKQLIYHIALRAKHYDDYAYTFVRQHPEGTIINLGCGLDSRYQRLPVKPKLFLDLDLPEMIAIKKELVEETEGYKLIGQSIFDERWMKELEEIPGPKLFIAEGLFMYLDEELMRDWLERLAETFSGSFLLFETVADKYTHGFRKKMVEFKFRKQFGVTGDVSYNFGLRRSGELEDLSTKYTFIVDWTYFDDHNPKVGWMNVMGRFKSLKYVQWTVFYKIR